MSDSKHPPKLIVILGPTASGKSDLSIKLARKFNGEIVSADSVQVYRDFDIGTAKTSVHERTRVPHHLLDVFKPSAEMTVAEYKKLAVKEIKNIGKRGRLPFLVGGTGFYVSAIADNLDIPRVPPNPALRDQLKIKSDKLGVSKLYSDLIKLDPEAANFVEPHNSRRVIRALEVIEATGQKLSELRSKGPQLFKTLQIGLEMPTDQLESNINKRVEQMFDQGLVDEVKNIMNKYGQVKPLEGIGYKEVVNYLNHEITLDEAKELIKLHTKQFAKRQMKWFRRDKSIKWVSEYSQAEDLINKFL